MSRCMKFLQCTYSILLICATKKKKNTKKGMLFLCLGSVRKTKLYNVGQKKNYLVGGLEIATNTVTTATNVSFFSLFAII